MRGMKNKADDDQGVFQPSKPGSGLRLAPPVEPPRPEPLESRKGGIDTAELTLSTASATRMTYDASKTTNRRKAGQQQEPAPALSTGTTARHPPQQVLFVSPNSSQERRVVPMPPSEDDDASISLAPTIDTFDRPGAHHIVGRGGRRTTSNNSHDDNNGRSRYSRNNWSAEEAQDGEESIQEYDGADTNQGGEPHLVTAYLVEEAEGDEDTNTKDVNEVSTGKPWRWIVFGAGLVLLAIFLGVVLGRNDDNNTANPTTSPDDVNKGTDTGGTPSPTTSHWPTTPAPTTPEPTSTPTVGSAEWDLIQTIPAPIFSALNGTFGRSLAISSGREDQANSGNILAIGGQGQVYVYFDLPEDNDRDNEILFDSASQPSDNAHLVIPLSTFISSPSPSFGASVKLSNDGFYMAVGEPLMQRIHVLFFDGNAWLPHGDSPIYASQNFYLGLSDTALAFARETKNVVAVGNGFDTVQVYDLPWPSPLRQASYDSWWTRGSALVEVGMGESGTIGLSDTGDILALGNPIAVPDLQGLIRVLKWNVDRQAWTQLGEDIQGLTFESYFGRSVALSGNGQVVAGGAKFVEAEGTRHNSGHVRVFEWKPSTAAPHNRQDDDDTEPGEWVQRGQTLSINSPFQIEFGRLVELNQDGTVLMVSIPFQDESSGAVEVFYYEEEQWQQRGEPLVGDISDLSRFIFGSALAMSADGNIIVTSKTNGDHLNSRWRRRKRRLQHHRRVQNVPPISSRGTVMLYQTKPKTP